MPGLITGYDRDSVGRFAAAATGCDLSSSDVLLAVSGGVDSLALLLLARAALGPAVAAATVDHGLNPAAALWGERVGALCDRLGVAHRTLADDVIVDGEGVQAGARRARYGALAGEAVRLGRTAVATAHQADDQAETLMMRLMRGSGLAGLAGVRAERPLGDGVRLVRPLLDWTRAELAAIVADAGLAPVNDPANRDPRFDRTRARALLAGLDPRPLARAASHLADAEAALDWATAQTADDRISQRDGHAFLDPAGLPHEIVRRLVAMLLPGADGPSVERLIARLRAGEAATLGPLKATPGAVWRFEPAPPRRPAPPPPAIVR